MQSNSTRPKGGYKGLQTDFTHYFSFLTQEAFLSNVQVYTLLTYRYIVHSKSESKYN